MLQLLRDLEQGTAIEQMLAGRMAYDPDTGAYLRRSMGRRCNSRPARYYLKLTYHELGEAIELTARSDEEAVEKARALYTPTRSRVAADDSPRRFDPVRGGIERGV
jgi:hypothetical protein